MVSVTGKFVNGVARPDETVEGHNGQPVIIIFVDQQPDAERVQRLHEQADAWLRRQAADAVREPAPLTAQERERLDAEFDHLLTQIRTRTADHSEDELAVRVERAVAAVRARDV